MPASYVYWERGLHSTIYMYQHSQRFLVRRVILIKSDVNTKLANTVVMSHISTTATYNAARLPYKDKI